MEKRATRSPAQPLPARRGASRDRGTSQMRRKRRADKPSRDEIARCISIWAAVYRMRDAGFDSAELYMPSRLWTGRLPPNIERFE
jgi:hypothetical protein